LRKEAAAKQDLAELVVGITARNRYAEADFGVPVGRELL
jgi:antitoxin component of MazEF toxin-antitoxin module